MSDGWRRAKRAVFSVATGLYAAVLVAATHYPKPERLFGGGVPPDKLLHFLAYGVLAVLATAASLARAPLTWTKAAVLAGGMAVFAMLDEITQPMFSRSAEPLDWVYDCIGIVIGIAIVAITSWAWERGSR
jgi:VanZ family protein